MDCWSTEYIYEAKVISPLASHRHDLTGTFCHIERGEEDGREGEGNEYDDILATIDFSPPHR